MRRKDREVTSPAEIFDILSRCDTLRIAMNGTEYPYIVPVSFGAERVNGQTVVYFHCAREGKKLDLLRADPRVAVEGDIFIKTETTDHGITTRYESAIGFGECSFPEDEEEIKHGLRLICGHYGYIGYSLDDCRALQFLRVGKIVLRELTGKRNLPAAAGNSSATAEKGSIV